MQSQFGVSDEITKSMDPAMVSARLFIGNLPTDALSRDQFVQRFSRYGRVLGVAIKKGFGFVQFSDYSEAQRACAQEANSLFHGNKIDVRLASEHRKRGGGEVGVMGGGGVRPRLDEYPGPGGVVGGGHMVGNPRSMVGGFQGPPSRFPPPAQQQPHQQSQQHQFHPGLSQASHAPQLQEPLYQEPNSRLIPNNQTQDPQYARKKEAERVEEERVEVRKEKTEPGFGRPFDAAILALAPEIRPYAEMLERRLIELGNRMAHRGSVGKERSGLKMNLSVDVLFALGGEEKVAGIVESFAGRGLLYVLVLQPQHAVHKSLTLNILHGSPQVEDALALMGTDFGEYVGRLRLGAEQPSLSFLLHLLADSRHLSLPEIHRILTHLESRKQLLLQQHPASAATLPSSKATLPPPADTTFPPTSAAPSHLLSSIPNTTKAEALPLSSVKRGAEAGGSALLGGYEAVREEMRAPPPAAVAVSQHVLAALGAKQSAIVSLPDPLRHHQQPPVSLAHVSLAQTAAAPQGLAFPEQVGLGAGEGGGVPSSAQINKTLNALLKNPDALRSLGLATLPHQSLHSTMPNPPPVSMAQQPLQQQSLHQQPLHQPLYQQYQPTWNNRL